MEATTIISFVTSAGMIGSLILNWVQYRASKKGTELNDFEKQLDVLVKLQDVKDEKYQTALKNKDLEIESLKKEVHELRSQVNKLTEHTVILQNAVNRLIGGGCKSSACTKRIPYPIDEIGDVLGIIGTE